MQISTTISCAIDHESFRVRQVAGMFDLPLHPRASRTYRVDLPEPCEPWQIGLITGPSGSGKSTIARAAYGDALYCGHCWPAHRAVIDSFPETIATRTIVALFTAVGFSSPPAWLRPYAVLSGGERFRCDLVRALLLGGDQRPSCDPPLAVFDEYTSVVDRTVAQIGSAAVARAIRGGMVARRFVAVTCHDDVADWLQPDWVLDMATANLTRRCLQRPQLNLEIVRCEPAAWRRFAPHHYLSAELNWGARCYLGILAGRPVAFAALLANPARQRTWRVSRIVVLPDFQGIGVGGRFLAGVAQIYEQQANRLTITTSHPAMIAHLRKSPRWRITAVKYGGYPRGEYARQKNIQTTSAGRTVVSAAWRTNGRSDNP